MNATACMGREPPPVRELGALGISVALHAAAVLGIAFMTLAPPREVPAVLVELLVERPPAVSEGPVRMSEVAPAAAASEPEALAPADPIPADPLPETALAPEPAPTPEPAPLPPRAKPRAEPTAPPRPVAAEAAGPVDAPVAAPPVQAPPAAVAAAPSVAVPAPPAPEPSTQSYGNALLRWLERYREYPRTARLRRIEGVVVLRLTIERGGRLLEVAVAESSGSPLLDDAALDMARRAAPMPPLPQGEGVERVVMLVPITYRLS